jgi:hypothetical protein
MIKKAIFLIFIFFLAGCASVESVRRNFPDSFYIKKDNLMFYQPKGAEFYDLKNQISKQEYRRLPSYLQDCYEKIGDI